MTEFDLNEEETRAELIDPALREAQWGSELTPNSRIRREYYFTDGKLVGGGKRGEADKADYLLTYRGKQLAIIEAKTAALFEAAARAGATGAPEPARGGGWGGRSASPGAAGRRTSYAARGAGGSAVAASTGAASAMLARRRVR